MRFYIPFLVLVFCYHSVHAEEVTFYTLLDSFSFSEPTSINSFLHDFNGDIQNGEYAFTKNKLEVGVQKGFYSLALVSRYDYFIEFNNGLAQAYYSANQGVLPEEGTDIEVYLKGSHLRSNGIKYGVHWQAMEGMTLLASITGLYADQMVDGEANGEAGYYGENEYRGEIHFDLYSYKDLLLDMPVPSPKGRGYTIDLRATWQLDPQWYVELNIEDGFSRVKWKDVLYSDLLTTSATVHFDSAGGLQTSPVVSGRQVIEDVTQILPVKYRAQLHYGINELHGVYIDAWHISSYLTMPMVGYSYRPSQNTEFRWRWDVKGEAFGMAYQNKNFKVDVATDTLSGKNAHSWYLSLSWSVPLEW